MKDCHCVDRTSTRYYIFSLSKKQKFSIFTQEVENGCDLFGHVKVSKHFAFKFAVFLAFNVHNVRKETPLDVSAIIIQVKECLNKKKKWPHFIWFVRTIKKTTHWIFNYLARLKSTGSEQDAVAWPRRLSSSQSVSAQ